MYYVKLKSQQQSYKNKISIVHNFTLSENITFRLCENNPHRVGKIKLAVHYLQASIHSETES